MWVDWRFLIVLPLISLMLVASGVLAYRAEWLMTQARLSLGAGDPLTAFALNIEAERAFPLDAVNRMQMVLTLGKVMNLPARVVIYHDAADRTWRKSASASPYHPLVVLLRLEYLLNSGRNPDEVEALTAFLAERMTLQPVARAAVEHHRRSR